LLHSIDADNYGKEMTTLTVMTAEEKNTGECLKGQIGAQKYSIEGWASFTGAW
jgi:hypothetical protein